MLSRIDEQARRVEDRNDLYEFAPDPIDDPIGSHDELAQLRPSELGNDSAELRELKELVWSRNQAREHEPCV